MGTAPAGSSRWRGRSAWTNHARRRALEGLAARASPPGVGLASLRGSGAGVPGDDGRREASTAVAWLRRKRRLAGTLTPAVIGWAEARRPTGRCRVGRPTRRPSKGNGASLSACPLVASGLLRGCSRPAFMIISLLTLVLAWRALLDCAKGGSVAQLKAAPVMQRGVGPGRLL
jgi:hypothetical protein